MPLRIPFLSLLALFAGTAATRAQPIHSVIGHDSAVFALAFRPDGRQLATGSFDCTIKLWDPANGQMQRTLTGHLSQISSLAFSPDGKTLASADTSGHILLWHPDDSSLPRRLEGHPLCAYAVAFAPDGQTLWSCSQD